MVRGPALVIAGHALVPARVIHPARPSHLRGAATSRCGTSNVSTVIPPRISTLAMASLADSAASSSPGTETGRIVRKEALSDERSEQKHVSGETARRATRLERHEHRRVVGARTDRHSLLDGL